MSDPMSERERQRGYPEYINVEQCDKNKTTHTHSNTIVKNRNTFYVQEAREVAKGNTSLSTFTKNIEDYTKGISHGFNIEGREIKVMPYTRRVPSRYNKRGRMLIRPDKDGDAIVTRGGSTFVVHVVGWSKWAL
jgi:hypothetical protein